jgi:hypothetical protein
MKLNGATQVEEMATQFGGRLRNNFQAMEQASLLTIALPHGFLPSVL